jgi:hypothetical protein
MIALLIARTDANLILRGPVMLGARPRALGTGAAAIYGKPARFRIERCRIGPHGGAAGDLRLEAGASRH